MTGNNHRRQFVTTDNQLDALALIEAIAGSDETAERAILRSYTDGSGGLIAGLVTICMLLANVGVQQGAWPTAASSLQLARLGIIDTEQE